jgi:hypothetical protein
MYGISALIKENQVELIRLGANIKQSSIFRNVLACLHILFVAGSRSKLFLEFLVNWGCVTYIKNHKCY